jgi:aminopeptidase N
MSAQNDSVKPSTTYLADYTPPAYQVEQVELHFALHESDTVVTSRLKLVARNPAGNAPLHLDGQGLELLAIELDGRPLAGAEYTLEAESLTIASLPARCELRVVTRIHPDRNTALEGLYVSSGNFCTQCEAEGFRTITYYPDRPDVMAVYTTTLEADKARYPVLLSNGNCIARGELADGRHFATWHDPFPKPCYLFALVAGDLACVRDSFTTRSGRQVALELYVQHGNEDKCAHALESLKKAMAWDERAYGREYDLDSYMIVAVDDFNMGAMENKGLNIFNSKYVLARPDTATDDDYIHIEGVIAHEYFHNWSGNRVTCRDWFQLSLKEGFTVFRDQQFTSDMNSAAVKRIDDVTLLRTRQFAEDAGPMAHPVRPASYVEINNFYTLTVYEKGAELIHMLHTLLGAEGFRRGSDLYFASHDGQAVTTDDFVAAMESANGVDLTQFKLWYSQAGTPQLSVTTHYDREARRYTLEFRQSTPPTPGEPEKKPLVIPVVMALLDSAGKEMTLHLEGETGGGEHQRVLQVKQARQQFVFTDIAQPPVPSLLRGFSAPVKLKIDLSDEQLAFLAGQDRDPFNRWESGQQLALRVILRAIETVDRGGECRLDPMLADAYGNTLADSSLDRALMAEALILPSEHYIAEAMEEVEPLKIHAVRQSLRQQLASAYRDHWQGLYHELADRGLYRFDAASSGRRRLRNLALAYLMELHDATIQQQCHEAFAHADNMTDALAALNTLLHTGAPQAEAALADFYNRWQGEVLVIDKWFMLQATNPQPGGLARVQALTGHRDFSLKNPNRLRSLIATFCLRNPAQFHRTDGAAYRFLADYVIELNGLNPQVASRLLEPLTHWRRFDELRQKQMVEQLERILASGKLSRDVYEVASKSL